MTEYIDAESYIPNESDGTNFRQIILLHLKKISSISFQEYRGGFWITTPSNNMNQDPLKRYIDDTREQYSNAVECLSDLLFPYFDEEMKDAEEKATTAKEIEFETHTIEKKEMLIDDNYFKERAFVSDKHKIIYSKIRQQINRKLFRALCCFLFRKKYLELGNIED